jgi:hypothetical protein
MLKKLIKKSVNIFKKIAPNKVIHALNKLRFSPVIKKAKRITNKISPDFTILNGPFKGIKYPTIDISELALVPKIIGSYEGQLIPLINELVHIPYNNIIDVGCAEGYYAVGLAKRLPKSIIHCFDINEFDLNFCKKMAEYNDLFNLTYNKFCSPDTLINFDYGERSLIFCDCEGYEIELFTDEVIRSLDNTDVLIELHDIHNQIISTEIIKRFAATHNVTIINNDNIDYSKFQSMNNLTPEENKFSTLEHRGGLYKNSFMEWGFFSPKTKSKSVGLYV